MKAHLKEIVLDCFRCYPHKQIAFDDGVNIILGKNAIGKTSLIEAIYMLGMCKSFRTNNDLDVVTYNNEYSFIKTQYHNGNGEFEITFSISNKGKNIFVNGKKIKALSDYIGFLNIISFTPDDIKIIKGDPKSRRKFLDLCIGQINKQYLKDLIEYNRLLKERNEILKKIDNIVNAQILLDTYSMRLIDVAKRIILVRKQFIEDINPTVNSKMTKLSNEKETVKIVYNPNCNVDNLLKEFKNRENLDKISMTTTCGPHRDDFEVLINEKSASKFGSQGQQRSIVLALKLAMADYIYSVTKHVIVVLDDVFGELDKNRQNELLNLIINDYQVFITTTSLQSLNDKVIKDSNIVNI